MFLFQRPINTGEKESLCFLLLCFFKELCRGEQLHIAQASISVNLSSSLVMNNAYSQTYQHDEQRWSLLMVSAQSGNEQDYQLLLTELAQAIEAYLFSRFGQQHFIEDCLQESLLAIHKARHTYDGQRAFRPWLFAIVRHKTIDYLRKVSANKRINTAVAQQGSTDENIGAPNYRQTSPEQHPQASSSLCFQQGSQQSFQQEKQTQHYQLSAYQQGEDQQQVIEDNIDSGSLLRALSVPDREVITLTKLWGYSCAEAAQKIGISEVAVKVRVHRAISKLRQLLEQEHYEQ